MMDKHNQMNLKSIPLYFTVQQRVRQSSYIRFSVAHALRIIFDPRVKDLAIIWWQLGMGHLLLHNKLQTPL
jgi:hypothetical protein